MWIFFIFLAVTVFIYFAGLVFINNTELGDRYEEEIHTFCAIMSVACLGIGIFFSILYSVMQA